MCIPLLGWVVGSAAEVGIFSALLWTDVLNFLYSAFRALVSLLFIEPIVLLIVHSQTLPLNNNKKNLSVLGGVRSIKLHSRDLLVGSDILTL